MEELKTKSGKKAYFTKEEMAVKKFHEMMQRDGFTKGKHPQTWISHQEYFFVGVAEGLGYMPQEWKEKLARKEPI